MISKLEPGSPLSPRISPVSDKMASNPIIQISPPTPRTTPGKQSLVDSVPAVEAITGIKIQFYFGLCSDYRADISDEEFQEFVDKIISPFFPNLSVSKLQGQWVSESSKAIVREPSKCVEILSEDTPEVHKKCGIICGNFKRLFLQDSVLRVVTPCTFYFH